MLAMQQRVSMNQIDCKEARCCNELVHPKTSVDEINTRKMGGITTKLSV
jgi:hypothetical protein